MQRYWHKLVEDAVFCDREQLQSYSQTPTKLCAMDGLWKMEQIGLLLLNKVDCSLSFISHFIQSLKREMTSPASIAYFKQHQPIGCRDVHTLKFLQEHISWSLFYLVALTLTLPHYTLENEEMKSYLLM